MVAEISLLCNKRNLSEQLSLLYFIDSQNHRFKTIELKSAERKWRGGMKSSPWAEGTEKCQISADVVYKIVEAWVINVCM